MRLDAPVVRDGVDQQQPSSALVERVAHDRAGQAGRRIGDLDPHAPPGEQEDHGLAAAAGHVPHDVGDQLGHGEFRRVRDIEQAPAVEVQPEDAAQMAGGVLADRQLGAVDGGLRVTGPGIGYVIHVTSVQCVDYSRLRPETNADRC
ncbi:hypothetical protein AMK10_10305 [Streptomyces sp. CB02058]|nr:hypothetical protein AMK10_10305 [Streptomyces sp. CB02058]